MAFPIRTFSAALTDLAQRQRIDLLRHAKAMGYPAAANAAIRATGDYDVVLLRERYVASTSVGRTIAGQPPTAATISAQSRRSPMMLAS